MSDIILTLEDNITVRRLREGDAEALTRHANNRKIWQNMTNRFPHPYKVEDSLWWIKHCNDKAQWLSTISPSDSGRSETKGAFEARRAESVLPTDYAICHLDKPIGCCGIELDVRATTSVSIGYWLGEEFWGRGIATQVATEFSKWIFDTFDWIVRVEGDAYSWNGGSQKVLRKSGFEYEGVQRMKAFKDGKYGDVVLFGKVRPGFKPVLMKTSDP
ncbi:hypothetical protein LTR70_001618 [Exophiala xenobiotica]|uniref:N-acetyltransferase domain-containing protein n=1 Tax=Lithohypha guttulata TaxID=1690604 RepID=A0ABR0K6T2_9EURO|nr:hypothetical protein LTR24_006140 [Lithohypha guttulata]KAK5327144.1 hypothetical protein LTR70_001618 [Exophiala xenobiotica]